MRIKTLFKNIPVVFPKKGTQVDVRGLCTDSRLVKAGDLFIALKGSHVDGNDFANDAARAGAVAILSDLLHPSLGLPQVITPLASDILPEIASRFYDAPHRKMRLIGITGTNGKTTTAYLLERLLSELAPIGVMSTIETRIGDRRIPSRLTTTDLVSNYRSLAEMASAGCRYAVMEVTSHGLAQKRVEGIGFDVAIFTNLSQDHLDFHHTIDKYAESKGLLFRGLSKSAHAIVNADDPYSKQMQSRCYAKCFTYGIDTSADIRATLNKKGFEIEGVQFVLPLIGKHNVYNALAAIATGKIYGLTLQEMAQRLKKCPQIPGRLEKIPNDRDIKVFVDFAHTPDALRSSLQTLSESTQARLITVFGCGGDRDREKRSKMGAVVQEFSDYAIITNDNPRSESPQSITEQIVRGFAKKEAFTVILDRKEAIERALSFAKSGDVVLIAGKGHEKEQIFQNSRIHFDDCSVVRDFFSKNTPNSPITVGE